MKGKIFAIEIEKSSLNKGTISIDIQVDDVNNWINMWSKKGMFEFNVELSHKEA